MVLAVTVGAVLAVPSAASADEAVFTSPCGFSHRAPDDPIVFPNQAGASHSHDFIGNLSTGAASTHDTLLGSDTACRRANDRAAYWVPTLYVNGAPVQPASTQIYYRGGSSRDPATIQAFPAGLRIIAGNSKATAPQSTKVMDWHCGSGAEGTSATTVPSCIGNDLVLRIRFPECWNGQSLDSPDHKGHMSYLVKGMCPATHPIPVPALALNVRYPTPGGPGVTLASGPHFTGHADFFNSWNQAELEHLVRTCINARANGEAFPCKPGQPRLLVIVKPGKLKVAKRRKTFRIGVLRPDTRSPVAGATVYFAGKKVTTDALGRAHVRKRIRRPGRIRAKAVKGAMIGESVSVRVRRGGKSSR